MCHAGGQKHPGVLYAIDMPRCLCIKSIHSTSQQMHEAGAAAVQNATFETGSAKSPTHANCGQDCCQSAAKVCKKQMQRHDAGTVTWDAHEGFAGPIA